MDCEQLRQQIATMRQSLFNEGILDQQFILVENLEREGNPNFAEDLSGVYYRDTFKWFRIIDEEMQKTPFDYKTVDTRLHQLKGSSASLGAIRVKNAVTEAHKLFHSGKLEEFKAALENVKREHGVLKAKLDAYFQLLNRLEGSGN